MHVRQTVFQHFRWFLSCLTRCLFFRLLGVSLLLAGKFGILHDIAAGVAGELARLGHHELWDGED